MAAGIAASILLSTLIGSLILGLAGWRTSSDVPIWGMALLQVPLWAGYLGVTVWATATKGNGPLRGIGASMRWFDVPVGLAVGVVTQLLVLPALYLPIFRMTGTSEDELSAPAEALAERAGSAASWVLFAVLVGLCAPVVEELFYRGLFLRSLTKRGMPEWVAVVVSAAVFGAIHFQVLQFAGLFTFGVIAGALASVTRRLGASVFAHIGFNMATVVLLYLSS
ncbi:MAG: CPBP family intramembrane glutamic endopeptidase [Microthrixaceae bacterium]